MISREDVAKVMWRAVSNRALAPASPLTEEEWEPIWRDRLTPGERDVWRTAADAVLALTHATTGGDRKVGDLYVVEESGFTEGGGADTIAICRTSDDAYAIVAALKASRGGFCERVGVYERDFDAPKSLIAEEG